MELSSWMLERPMGPTDWEQRPPEMPRTRKLSTSITEAEWEELEAILMRKDTTSAQYLRKLIRTAIAVNRALYSRYEPF